jgi:glycosidase
MIPAWVKDAVFYQIFPDRFNNGNPLNDPPDVKPWSDPPTINGFQGGDLDGIIKKLDYLVDFGINAIYLNPIFLSPSTHRYDTVDYFQIDPKLGGLDTFHQLIENAHRRRIRIILDGVFNHTGIGFFAFNDILENGEKSLYRNWYHINHFPVDAYGDEKAKDYLAWWGFRSLPKLNTDHKPVRDYIFSVAKYWLEQGADGWRLDVPNEIADPGFWEEFRAVVKSTKPDAYLLGEIWEVAPTWVDEKHFDGLMNYPLRASIIDFLSGKSPSEVLYKKIQELNQAYTFEQLLGMYNLLGSHDSERILTLLHGNSRLVKLAYLILLTFPGAPAIYYGDEVGVKGGKDPECRKTFPWDAPRRNSEIYDWLEKLIQFRKIFNPLRSGLFIPIQPQSTQDVFAFIRSEERRTFVTIINRSKKYVTIDLDLPAQNFPAGKVLNNLLGEEKFVIEVPGKLTDLSIAPETGFLLH